MKIDRMKTILAATTLAMSVPALAAAQVVPALIGAALGVPQCARSAQRLRRRVQRRERRIGGAGPLPDQALPTGPRGAARRGAAG